MSDAISDLANRLAGQAEAVCRHYLSNGHRDGRYWRIGDVHNTPGRSLYVRLDGSGAGRWADAATTEYGDLIDLIAAAGGLNGIGEALNEARRFLGLDHAQPSAFAPPGSPSPTNVLDGVMPAADAGGSLASRIPAATDEAARRLFRLSRPIAGTLASTYLKARGILVTPDAASLSLRFHPRCWYRADPASPVDTPDAWPALIAAVTDSDGVITAVQRTWLDRSGHAKAPVTTPRRAMGHLLGHAVRFGTAGDVMAVGEGIETMLSLCGILPALPLAAALSATHLAALRLPPVLRRLYIVRDNDPAGQRAVETLTTRAQGAGVEALPLTPILGDLNDDLRQLGASALAASIRLQLAPQDVTRFWRPTAHGGGSCEHGAT